MDSFKKRITDYLCSGHALLSVSSFEKDRVISEIQDACKQINKTTLVWSISQGWINTETGAVVANLPKAVAPIHQHLEELLGYQEEDTVFVLKDFGPYVKHDTYPENWSLIIALLDDLKLVVASLGQSIIFVGPEFDRPKSLIHDITEVEFDLPKKDHIEERIRFACSDVETSDGSKFELNEKVLPHIVDACRGMTSHQVLDRVALALRVHKGLNDDSVRTIINEKASIIKSSGLLEYREPPEGGLGLVGGYEGIKKHIELDKPCFTEEAREFGIKYPKGLMLVGIPGCGKTLISTAVASELGLPLICMDVSNLMDKYVGESERHMKQAIKMLESIAPCVLMLDEIEKGFGGAGDMDGGASRRVFGTFIKWLNDRTSPVYAIATANQVQSLPPEFCRKGRFDEIYGLDLPDKPDRQEIFKIHIEKRNRNPEHYDTLSMADITEGYTGADIEQIIELSLKQAFFEGSELSTKHILTATKEITPLSKTEENRIQEIRNWCSKHAKPSTSSKVGSQRKTNKRTVAI